MRGVLDAVTHSPASVMVMVQNLHFKIQGVQRFLAWTFAPIDGRSMLLSWRCEPHGSYSICLGLFDGFGHF